MLKCHHAMIFTIFDFFKLFLLTRASNLEQLFFYKKNCSNYVHSRVLNDFFVTFMLQMIFKPKLRKSSSLSALKNTTFRYTNKENLKLSQYGRIDISVCNK